MDTSGLGPYSSGILITGLGTPDHVTGVTPEQDYLLLNAICTWEAPAPRGQTHISTANPTHSKNSSNSSSRGFQVCHQQASLQLHTSQPLSCLPLQNKPWKVSSNSFQSTADSHSSEAVPREHLCPVRFSKQRCSAYLRGLLLFWGKLTLPKQEQILMLHAMGHLNNSSAVSLRAWG